MHAMFDKFLATYTGRLDADGKIVVGAVDDFTAEELALGEQMFDQQPESPWTAFLELRELFGAMSLERRQDLYDVVAKRRIERRIECRS